MSKKGTTRKNDTVCAREHKQFLELVSEKRPELEIMKTLKLSRVQLKEHTLKALQKAEVAPADLVPAYEVVSIKSLPAVLREHLALSSDDDVETLVEAGALAKLEIHEDGILLTLLPVVPRSFVTETVSQGTDEDAAEMVSDDTDEEAETV